MTLPLDPDLASPVSAPVDPDTGAPLDCVACGACCAEASDGRVLVSAQDLGRWRREGREDLVAATVDGHFGERAFASTPDGDCVHLERGGGRAVCRIYETRGETCREFQAGSWQCLEFRRARQRDSSAASAASRSR
ncbi:MAG: YkgJ family cysteine cluster protein [Polyangiaceae bacterium]|nr:YkgJ family cysteine cluster protein [Polyangiaceae bacterium]